MVTGDALKARRHAREIVAELRWSGMTVPPLYARMANEFEDLVRSGDYAAWVAANQTPAPMGRKLHVAGHPSPVAGSVPYSAPNSWRSADSCPPYTPAWPAA